MAFFAALTLMQRKLQKPASGPGRKLPGKFLEGEALADAVGLDGLLLSARASRACTAFSPGFLLGFVFLT